MPGGVTTDVKTYSMLINGEWVASKSAKSFPVYDPSTEEVIAQVPDANADDVNRAVAAAKAAFEDGTVGDHDGAGAGASSLPACRESAPEPSHARRTRMPQLGQADC